MRYTGLVAVLAACTTVDARPSRHSHRNHKRQSPGHEKWHVGRDDGVPRGSSYPIPHAAYTTQLTVVSTTVVWEESTSTPPTPATSGDSSPSIIVPSTLLAVASSPSISQISSSSSGAVSLLSTGNGSSSSAVSAYPTGYGSINTTAWSVNSTNSTNATSPSAVDFSGIRGVNVGGWLVLEKWMTSDLFSNSSACDQYTYDQTDGAAEALQTHWDTYFTEDDVQKIAAWGLNALRIPIGYWAYNNTGTPYITGADAYMEKAIGWARQYGLKVLVDCHGSPGSQNGFDNSGREGNVAWQSDDNLQLSISVLETMAEKYGSESYADVVFGLELVNEPISWGANDFNTTQTWAQKAYAAVKAKATNPNLIVVMHDGFEGPSDWTTVSNKVNAVNGVARTKSHAQFAVDTHLYQNQEDSDSTLTQAQHVAKACGWASSALLPESASLPVYVGEFSAQTNICANPDNSTVAGSSCDVDGCQCATDTALEDWHGPLRTATRQFFEAQVQAFEYAAQGWFLWSWKGPGSWGLSNLIDDGVLGERVSDVAFLDLCSLRNGTVNG